MSDEPTVGEGTTTLDYLLNAYPWLKDEFDKSWNHGYQKAEEAYLKYIEIQYGTEQANLMRLMDVIQAACRETYAETMHSHCVSSGGVFPAEVHEDTPKALKHVEECRSKRAEAVWKYERLGEDDE